MEEPKENQLQQQNIADEMEIFQLESIKKSLEEANSCDFACEDELQLLEKKWKQHNKY